MIFFSPMNETCENWNKIGTALPKNNGKKYPYSGFIKTKVIKTYQASDLNPIFELNLMEYLYCMINFLEFHSL